MAESTSGPSAGPAAPDCDDEAYERFKRELHDGFRLIARGHRIPPVDLGGLTAAETDVVIALSHALRHGIEARPSKIARFIDSTPSALSQTLRSLERKGYVARRRLGTDSRGVVLDLTDEGRRLADEGETALDDRFRELFAYLGEDDARTLLRVFGRMVAFLTGSRGADGADPGEERA